MISTLKNNERFVFAYILWETVDQLGNQDPKGEYLYISDLWIHPTCRRLTALKELIKIIDSNEASQSAKWVYWKREKYGDRFSKTINRLKIAKKGVSHVE